MWPDVAREQNSRPGVGTGAAAQNRLTTYYADDTPSAPAVTTDEAARCIACHRPIVAAASVRRGLGPHCWTRVTAAQRHERAAALHARLWSLLRRLPDLDVDALTRLSDALDDLDSIGGAR